MRQLYRNLDQAQWLASLLRWFRVKLPAQRGLVVLLAIGLTVVSLIVHIAWIATGSVILGICGFVLLHLAIIGGFLGILIAEALGRGYRE